MSGESKESIVARLEAKVAAQEKQLATLESVVPELQRKLSEAQGKDEPRWSGNAVRTAFLSFMQGRKHTFYPASPITGDPTLLFTNSGMVQYKPIFLGLVEPGSPFEGLKRACNSQKCIRAGGKHNDLDDVGKDSYHHTFFEMLGNWSFGDYFKEEAIEMALVLLTEVYGLSKDRLYATYFEGDAEAKLEPDLEAKERWERLLDPSHVIPGDKKDNFWEMGDTGPCGPCSELHYDRIGGRNAAAIVNQDDPNVIEIWNLVFMQYNREASGELKPLPDTHVDTGMGFERITSILQDKMSNYDTDIFTPIFDRIHDLADGKPAYAGKIGDEDEGGVDMAYRVIADHIRNLTIAISDGCYPGNKDQGYVLRRILRRGVRYGKYMLGMPDGFFPQLVDVCVATLKSGFPEIVPKAEKIKTILGTEERLFLETLDTGMKLFEDEARKALKAGTAIISGQVAFDLYATHGFPSDLTEILAEEHKPPLTVDMAGYEVAYKRHQEDSKGTKADGGVRLHMEPDHTKKLQDDGVAATDDQPKFGDVTKPTAATVRAIFTVDGFVDAVGPEEKKEEGAPPVVALVLDATPFYAEGGGQIFDTGTVTCASGDVLQVSNVQRCGIYVLHTVDVSALSAGLRVGDSVQGLINVERRLDIAPNHTCTHVLNYALRQVLVTHGDQEVIDQKGSEVTPDKLRFDFSCSRPIKPDELAKIEAIVNGQIAEKLPVRAKVVPLAEAHAINSLRAVFGEAYPDPVRVVVVGEEVANVVGDPENEKWLSRSVELCGGTHMADLSEAGDFVIIEETSKSAGVRRITALTRGAARTARVDRDAFGKRLTAAFGLAGEALIEEEKALVQCINKELTISQVDKHALLKEIKKLTKQVIAAKKKKAKEVAAKASAEGTRIATEAKESGRKVVLQRFDFGSDMGAAKKMIAQMQKVYDEAAYGILSADEDKGKLTFIVGVSKALEAQMSATDWTASVRDVLANSKGGGKPNFAQLSGDLELDRVGAIGEVATKFAESKLN